MFTTLCIQTVCFKNIILKQRYNVLSVDTISPVLNFTGTLPDNVNNNNQKFSWTSSEYAQFTCFIDSETQHFPCGSGKRGSWTSSELLDGSHTFRVFGTDTYGNQGPVIQHTWDIGRHFVFFCCVLYCTVLYCTVPYHTVPYRTVPYRTVPYRTVPYCTVLYCTVLKCYFHVIFSLKNPHSQGETSLIDVN